MALIMITPAVGMAGIGQSIVLTAMIVVFVAVCLRYRTNHRYFTLILNDIVDVRERHNVFDDTLREMTFIFLLNLLWCLSTGLILYGWLLSDSGQTPWSAAQTPEMLLCMTLMAAYTLFMTCAYATVGTVFSDAGLTQLWVKGYHSSQGLSAVAMFPLAMLCVTLPEKMHILCIITLILFILSKLLFIYKGFCIFFSKSTYWVPFLYYLCSLEIIPVIILYVVASRVCI